MLWFEERLRNAWWESALGSEEMLHSAEDTKTKSVTELVIFPESSEDPETSGPEVKDTPHMSLMGNISLMLT